MTGAQWEEVDWQGVGRLVWGRGAEPGVFQRWLQPIQFSPAEPSALLQRAGGPCAVLAPLQATLLKCALAGGLSVTGLAGIGPDTAASLLAGAVAELLGRAAAAGQGGAITLATVPKQVATAISDSSGGLDDSDSLHSCFALQSFPSPASLVDWLEKHHTWGGQYDVLSLLYSVVLTKGPDLVRVEREDGEESLVDSVHGHGSQSLVNLLLTGRATQNVWDGERDLCGLRLQGVAHQPEVGFLTYLECLRYCEVGSRLKSPAWPVWVLGSETHLTVLFSPCRALAGPPPPRHTATQAFNRIDTEGAGFIPADQLGPLLTELDLFADPAYVELVRGKLDPDGLGVLLLPAFLEEFFPDQVRGPDSFSLLHYNGLAGPGGQTVRYR